MSGPEAGRDATKRGRGASFCFAFCRNRNEQQLLAKIINNDDNNNNMPEAATHALQMPIGKKCSVNVTGVEILREPIRIKLLPKFCKRKQEA